MCTSTRLPKKGPVDRSGRGSGKLLKGAQRKRFCRGARTIQPRARVRRRNGSSIRPRRICRQSHSRTRNLQELVGLRRKPSRNNKSPAGYATFALTPCCTRPTRFSSKAPQRAARNPLPAAQIPVEARHRCPLRRFSVHGRKRGCSPAYLAFLRGDDRFGDAALTSGEEAAASCNESCRGQGRGRGNKFRSLPGRGKARLVRSTRCGRRDR